MNLSVTGHHIDITESMKVYISEKMEKLTRHFDNVIDVHVICTVEKLRHTAEATILLSGAKLFADATEEDMYAAIDSLTSKLDRQVIKHKEKIKDHRKRDKIPA
jgi:putative sigma-54 modulation protein